MRSRVVPERPHGWAFGGTRAARPRGMAGDREALCGPRPGLVENAGRPESGGLTAGRIESAPIGTGGALGIAHTLEPPRVEGRPGSAHETESS